MGMRTNALRNLARGWVIPRLGPAVGLSMAFLLLLPFGTLYNVPLVVLCGLGLAGIVTNGGDIARRSGPRLFLSLFLCVWLPMVIASVDAVNISQSLRKAASFPVLFLAGIYLVASIRRMADLLWLLVGFFVVWTLWSVDAIWQFLNGRNLLGFPHEGGRVSGMFFPDLELGVVLAVGLPFFLEAIRQLMGRNVWVVLASIPFMVAVALCGSRSSWVIVAMVLVAYAWYLVRLAERPIVRRGKFLRVAAVGGIMCVAAAYVFPHSMKELKVLVIERTTPVVETMSTDARTSDVALVGRLTAWESAWGIFRAHWINGVGPRGFRDVHGEYAPSNDPYVQKGKSLAHPHLFVMEIAAETGSIGLIGYLVALVLLTRRFLAMTLAERALGFPYVLAIFVVLFPFATHMAFYAHFMASVIWWVIAVSAAGLGAVACREMG